VSYPGALVEECNITIREPSVTTSCGPSRWESPVSLTKICWHASTPQEKQSYSGQKLDLQKKASKGFHGLSVPADLRL